MRYILEVEGTEVVLKCLQDDGTLLKRSFVCSENEMIAFSVYDGQLLFSGHMIKPALNPMGISVSR